MITYVSAFFPSKHPKRGIETYRLEFEKMANTGISIVLFLDESIDWKFPQNVHIIPSRFSDTWIDQAIPEDVELPSERSTFDTVEYLKIQHSKTEWLIRAIELNPYFTEWFAWIDFALPHVFQDSNTVHILARMIPPFEPKLVTPGIWTYCTSDIWDRVQWRFAGGFLLGHKDILLVLHERLKDLVLKTLPKFAWEVNYWAKLEEEIDFGWFQSDHNDTMITAVP